MAKKILIISVLLLAAAFPVKGNENSEMEELYRFLLDHRQAVRDEVAQKLIRLLPPVKVQSLVTDLQDKDPAKRFLACYRLSELRPKYRYIPIMFNLMKDSHPYIREVAYKTIGPYTTNTRFYDYYQDYIKEDIAKTTKMLGQITSPEIIGPLIASIDCKTVGMGHCDHWVIYKMLELIRPRAALPSIRQRITKLKDYQMVRLLGHIPDKKNIPVLLKVLRITREEFTPMVAKWHKKRVKDKNYIDWSWHFMKYEALWALGEIGGPRAMAVLERYFYSEDDSFKDISACGLLKINHYKLYKPIADWINSKSDCFDVGGEVWEELSGNKKNALKILPHLSQPEAILILSWNFPEEFAKIPGMLDKLTPLLETNTDIRLTTLEQLLKLLPLLVARVENNTATREELIDGLYRLVKENDAYWDDLLELAASAFETFTNEKVPRLFIPDLENDNPDYRYLAVRVLGNPAYKHALPHLLPMLEDPEIRLRRSACAALVRMGDDSAIPHLINRLFDPSFLIREDAADALRTFNKPAAILSTASAVSFCYGLFSRSPGMLRFLEKRLMPGNENRPEPKQQAKKEESLIRDMVIGQEKGLTLLTFDPEKRQYRPTHSHEIPGPRCISVSGDSVFASSNGDLYRFDSRLRKERQARIGKKIRACIATGDGAVFAAAQSSILAFDAGLHLSDVFKIPVSARGSKDAHDFLISGQRLYVLDNFISPYYILTVDVKNRYQLKLEKKHVVLGSSHWLEAQALDAKKREWLVLSHNTKGSLALYTFDSETVRLKSEFFRNLDYEVMAMLSGSPPKALIIKDFFYYLASINTELTKPVFFDLMPLNTRDDRTFDSISYSEIDIAIKQRGPYIYVTIGDNLLVLDSNGIVLSLKLESPVLDFDLL